MGVESWSSRPDAPPKSPVSGGIGWPVATDVRGAITMPASHETSVLAIGGINSWGVTLALALSSCISRSAVRKGKVYK